MKLHEKTLFAKKAKNYVLNRMRKKNYRKLIANQKQNEYIKEVFEKAGYDH